MLRKIGVSSPWELFRDIPRQLIMEKPPRIGYGGSLSEYEVIRIVNSKLSKNKVFFDPPPFMGGGLCLHHVPTVVDYLVSRSEFYTAYTPYQPEINQGLLQALFEYQSLVADLLEMDIVNASMYDMSTAVAEAVLMALRVTRRRKILVPSTMHPEHYEVLKTWLLGHDTEIVKLGYDKETGYIDRDSLDQELQTNNVAAVYVEIPSYLGFIENDPGYIADQTHKHGGLLIVGVEPLSLGIIKPPGRYGADIVVGEGQPLGLGLNYGGPLLGIFATKMDRRLIRQLPGRLIGVTRTIEGGREGYIMILQTREQHIKREKATSNITTNEALMAITAAIYLSLLGGKGLRELAEAIWVKSHYLAKRLSELPGVKAPLFNSPFFKEFTTEFPREYKYIFRKLSQKGILGGLGLEGPPLYNNKACLFCVTELHSRRDIDKLVEALGEIL